MSTNVHAVINAAADEADNLLEGVTKPAEARPLLLEWLAENHSGLDPAQRETVTAEVLALLEKEGFFVGGGPDQDEPDPDDGSEPDE